jgi:hypothetical protein
MQTESVKRFEDHRPIVQLAIDWQITRHMESRWKQTGNKDGLSMDEEGRPVTDLTAYRKRMRDKILAGPELDLLALVERYSLTDECREAMRQIKAASQPPRGPSPN